MTQDNSNMTRTRKVPQPTSFIIEEMMRKRRTMKPVTTE